MKQFPPPQLIRELGASDGDGGIGIEWTGSLLTHPNKEQGEKWWGEPALLSQRSQVLPDVLSPFCVDRLRVLTAHQNLGLASRESLLSARQTRQHEVSFTQLGRSSKPSVGLHKRPLKVTMHTILTLLKVLTQSLKLLRLALNSQGLDFFFF